MAKARDLGYPDGFRGRLELCEQRIDYRFNDKRLLKAALTHASGADHRLASNERLEFLGDAILGVVVCEQLYDQFPHLLEGDLTKIKSVVVSRQTCARVSAYLKLEDCLILGKGMSANPTVPASLLADVFESLVAAIHLDSGFEAAAEFIHRFMDSEIDRAVSGAVGANHKSQLQQLVQREHGTTPTYRLLDEKGPDHDKCFQVAAKIGDRLFSPAWGPNKKEAEQRAAELALDELEDDSDVASVAQEH
jgi:ribonuclease-3